MSSETNANDLSPAAGLLSKREIQVLRLVATGASNREIAKKLTISPNTVKVHLFNTFSKLGVASRTEATVFAIREGLVDQLRPGATLIDAETSRSFWSLLAQLWRDRKLAQISAAGLVVLAALLALGAVLLGRPANSSPSDLSPPPQPLGWIGMPALPTARRGLAVALYKDSIYAIGGETDTGVTGATERYDIAEGKWIELPGKPTAVTDVQAGVVGGMIYVPGGRLLSGAITNVVEAYIPSSGRWERRSPLPRALSAYALVAFEGNLYLFGGWDGDYFVASVYLYDPQEDLWQAGRPMPTARGYAGAAIAGSGIWVIGGYDGVQALAVNEFYSPFSDITTAGESPGTVWIGRSSIPAERFKMGVATTAGIVYIVGGEGSLDTGRSFRYLSTEDRWEELEVETEPAWSELGLIAHGRYLYALGGSMGGQIVDRNAMLEAVYILLIPVFR